MRGIKSRAFEPEARNRKMGAARESYAIIGPATRARILDAALKCILKKNCHGTTTLLVHKMAGVSRGSLLNPFPTKADLMTALSEQILKERSKSYVAAYARRERLLSPLRNDDGHPVGSVPQARRYCATGNNRRCDQRSRVDEAVRAAESRHGCRAAQQTWAAAGKIGVTDRVALDHVITQSMAALRGLAIDLLYPRPDCDTDAAFALIKKTHMEAIDRVIRVYLLLVGEPEAVFCS
ncbi:MAG: TetR/AcrR family transcriptional regulator [Alphaproteobacteria bacterium]